MSGQIAHRSITLPDVAASETGFLEDVNTSVYELANSIEYMSTPAPSASDFLRAFTGNADQLLPQNDAPILAKTTSPNRELYLDNYLAKMADYENAYQEDVYLERDRYPVLISTFKRLDRVQNLVGHGNFNVVSFDEMLKYGKRYSSVGEFTQVEKDFLEELFFANARQYGFLGDKVITEISAPIPERDRRKVGRTGHFLYRGKSEALYDKLQKDVGSKIVLTSGIRSVVKQSHLFLAKTIQSKGNLSKASRSLAPPGHSYHGIGDFDVGKVGFGRKNFTEAFASTDEYKRLVDLGYVDIRYPRDNMFGVRYEPWHIKVV